MKTYRLAPDNIFDMEIEKKKNCNNLHAMSAEVSIFILLEENFLKAKKNAEQNRKVMFVNVSEFLLMKRVGRTIDIICIEFEHSVWEVSEMCQDVTGREKINGIYSECFKICLLFKKKT